MNLTKIQVKRDVASTAEIIGTVHVLLWNGVSQNFMISKEMLSPYVGNIYVEENITLENCVYVGSVFILNVNSMCCAHLTSLHW